MKEHWNINSKKIARLEEGLVQNVDDDQSVSSTSSTEHSRKLIRFVKAVLYIEIAFLLGWSCYWIWDNYRNKSSEVKILDIAGNAESQHSFTVNLRGETSTPASIDFSGGRVKEFEEITLKHGINLMRLETKPGEFETKVADYKIESDSLNENVDMQQSDINDAKEIEPKEVDDFIRSTESPGLELHSSLDLQSVFNANNDEELSTARNYESSTTSRINVGEPVTESVLSEEWKDENSEMSNEKKETIVWSFPLQWPIHLKVGDVDDTDYYTDEAMAKVSESQEELTELHNTSEQSVRNEEILKDTEGNSWIPWEGNPMEEGIIYDKRKDVLEDTTPSSSYVYDYLVYDEADDYEDPNLPYSLFKEAGVQDSYNWFKGVVSHKKYPSLDDEGELKSKGWVPSTDSSENLEPKESIFPTFQPFADNKFEPLKQLPLPINVMVTKWYPGFSSVSSDEKSAVSPNNENMKIWFENIENEQGNSEGKSDSSNWELMFEDAIDDYHQSNVEDSDESYLIMPDVVKGIWGSFRISVSLGDQDYSSNDEHVENVTNDEIVTDNEEHVENDTNDEIVTDNEEDVENDTNDEIVTDNEEDVENDTNDEIVTDNEEHVENVTNDDIVTNKEEHVENITNDDIVTNKEEHVENITNDEIVTDKEVEIKIFDDAMDSKIQTLTMDEIPNKDQSLPSQNIEEGKVEIKKKFKSLEENTLKRILYGLILKNVHDIRVNTEIEKEDLNMLMSVFDEPDVFCYTLKDIISMQSEVSPLEETYEENLEETLNNIEYECRFILSLYSGSHYWNRFTDVIYDRR